MALTFNPVTNEGPFTHTSRNGTQFTAARCDFQGGVHFVADEDISEAILLQDVSEMIGFHATNILEHLNGFQGYDCVAFTRSE